VAGLILLAAAACLAVWLTRISFKQHDQSVDLLRSMGASDRYIAQQFEQNALGSSLRGTLIGFVAGLSTVVAVLYGGSLLGAEPPVEGGLGAVYWVLLAIVPLITALLIAVAARLTALFGLARLR
jgi:cell division transport system permease protein